MVSLGLSGKQYYKGKMILTQEGNDQPFLEPLANRIISPPGLQARGQWSYVWGDSDISPTRCILVVEDALGTGIAPDITLHDDIMSYNAAQWMAGSFSELLMAAGGDPDFNSIDISRMVDPIINGF